MRSEIQAAINHLCTLFSTKLDGEQTQTFCVTLHTRLEQKYSSNWFVHDGERGSAKRVLLWHAHGGGEGMDDDITFALKKVSSLRSFEDAFTSSFTLWIDPGCVAIRLGQGPGTFVGANHIPSPNSIKTLYGTLPSSALSTIQAMTPAPPKLALLPSTPALDTDEADTTATFGNHQMSKHSLTNSLLHYRAPSWSTSSHNEHLLDGHRTASSGSEGEGSEACPSLVAASSTRGDSDSELFDEGDEDDDTDSELSIQDMMDRGGFKNYDIIDDDDEEEDVGDETVQHIKAAKNNTSTSTKSPAKSISVTSYDGGNVGVLGGGVRLGASKPSAHLQRKTSNAALRAKQAAAPVWYPSQQLSNTQSPALSPSNMPHNNQAAWSPYSPNMGMYSPSINTSGCPSPQYIIVDGVAVPIATPPLKRGRARGRRSRGRGAGRAARRQAAAALKSQEELYGWSPLDEASSASSALGITLNPTNTATNVPDLESEERLMAMVRQRADQVAKDLVRRHLEQQKQQQQQQQQYTPRQTSTPTLATSQQIYYHHQPQAYLPAHMMSHVQPQRHQMANFSPISQNAQWIH